MLYNSYASIDCDPLSLTSSSKRLDRKCQQLGLDNQTSLSIAIAYNFLATSTTTSSSNDGKHESFASQHIVLLAEIIGGGVGACLILILMTYVWFRCCKYEKSASSSYSVIIPTPIIATTANVARSNSNKYHSHKWIKNKDELLYI